MSRTLHISPIAYEQVETDWLADHRPYLYQKRVYDKVEAALAEKRTLCLFLVTPTGSGKTLAAYAYAINHRLPPVGVYPTNELIRDQERSLKPWFDPDDNYELLRVDSRQLDYWQTVQAEKRHAPALERLFEWKTPILTNPDILFYIFFGLYGAGKKKSEDGPGYLAGQRERLFNEIGQRSYFVFDEFHLYNVKQMADVAFLVGTLHAINPNRGRVFIFASATPELEAVRWLRDNLGLAVEVIEARPSTDPQARLIAHPLELTLLPADLKRWQAAEALLDYLPALRQFVADYPQARLVTILDSVAGAINATQLFREAFPAKSVGEVHGFSSEEERATALRQEITVGTSTIEVGIDFKGETEKDLLLYEARTAAQFVQRFGRLARHAKESGIPNRVVALTPDYVYNFLAERLADQATLSRAELYQLLEEAYLHPNDFPNYLHKHAPAEFHESRAFVERMFQEDDRPRVTTGINRAIHLLTGQTGQQAKGKHWSYKSQQILYPLLTFRGNSFEAGIIDARGVDVGFPIKRYSLMFLLRRGEFEEIDGATYRRELERLADRWPAEAAREDRYSKRIGSKPWEMLGLYGYFRLTGLREKSRQVWFELPKSQVSGKKAHVKVISELEVVTEPPLRTPALNRLLRRKQIVAWFCSQHPATIKLGRALPPLFELYTLYVLRGGSVGSRPWSIAFNQDAFFVDSLGWWKQSREDDAIIL